MKNGFGLKNIKQFKDFANETVIEIFEAENKKLLYNLWDEIVPNTPVRSGLAMFSWRMTPGQKSTYKPIMDLDDGSRYDPVTGKFSGYVRIYPEPDRPVLEKYTRKWKNYYLFNNQDYVAGLNENEDKYYYQFIEDGIQRAIFRSKSKKSSLMTRKK